MDCSEKSEGAVAAIPDDPLVEILSRVPAKSVCRFKCVSKAWRDLIADPHHRKKLPQVMQGLFMAQGMDPGFRFRYGFIDLTVRSVPLDIDPGFSFLTGRPEIQRLILQDSCNGLILFRHRKDAPSFEALGYIVCNPTTKRWAAVPTCVDSPAWVYLAFDQAISSHFHLVQFQVSMENKVVSLHAYSSETGTWSRNQIGSQENQGPLAQWHRRVKWPDGNSECAVLNGFLHFIVWNLDRLQIVVVDVQGNTRRIIPVPGVADDLHRYCRLGQSQGCLHYMTQDILRDQEEQDKLSMSIWVLQDYDTQEWVLKKTLGPWEFFGELTRFRVAGIHQDCNVVFLLQLSSGKLIAYDMDREEKSVISSFKFEDMAYHFHRYVPCFSEFPALSN